MSKKALYICSVQQPEESVGNSQAYSNCTKPPELKNLNKETTNAGTKSNQNKTTHSALYLNSQKSRTLDLTHTDFIHHFHTAFRFVHT